MFGLITQKQFDTLAARVAKLERKKPTEKLSAPSSIADEYPYRGINMEAIKATREIMHGGKLFNADKLLRELHKAGWQYKKGSVATILAVMAREGDIERAKWGQYRIKKGVV